MRTTEKMERMMTRRKRVWKTLMRKEMKMRERRMMRTTEKMERMMGRMTKRGQDLFQLPSHFFFCFVCFVFFFSPPMTCSSFNCWEQNELFVVFLFFFSFFKKEKNCAPSFILLKPLLSCPLPCLIQV